MANVLIRDLPADVHEALIRHAERRNQSLQQYLVAELTLLVKRRSIDEVIAAIERRQSERIGFAEAVEAIQEERQR